MTGMVSRRQLVGRRIVGFEPHPSKDGPHGSTVHDPVIYLDDGSQLRFIAEELEEGGNYGVLIRKTKARYGA